MPILFQTMPGSVVRLNDPALQCNMQLLKVGTTLPNGVSDGGIDFNLQRAIITRVVISQQVNVQFLHTMGSHVYIYVFGDRIGSIDLSGLAFSCPCPDTYTPVVGAEAMFSWYKQYRASTRKSPIEITIGTGQVLQGFVIGFTEDVVDPSLNLVQWGVNLVSLPET